MRATKDITDKPHEKKIRLSVEPGGSCPLVGSLGATLGAEANKLQTKKDEFVEDQPQLMLEGRTLTRDSNSEFTSRVSKLPTFPLLGF
jgi:hypothetical protein